MTTTVNSAANYLEDQFSHMWRVTEVTISTGAIGDGDEAAKTITVNGVALGDMVLGVSLSIDSADLTVTASVTAANTVDIVYANNTGGSVTPASHTAKLLIGRPVW